MTLREAIKGKAIPCKVIFIRADGKHHILTVTRTDKHSAYGIGDRWGDGTWHNPLNGHPGNWLPYDEYEHGSLAILS